MGVYAAHCMASVSSELTVVDTMATTDPNGFSNVPQVSCEVGFAFELFTHITHLFDYKVRFHLSVAALRIFILSVLLVYTGGVVGAIQWAGIDR